MSSPVNENDKSKKASRHDSGAMSAWGMVGGALLGALAGWFFGKALFGAVILGVIGWIGGALIDRARR